MDLPLVDAMTFIAGEVSYVSEFRAAFDGRQPSVETLQRALASFIRTLVSGNSPYDQALRGDIAGLPKPAQRGEALFFSKAGCFRCHPAGPLSNGGYFNNGSYVEGGDPGRQALTGLAGDRGKFRVPSLRNVAVSAPYMHDGSLPTLRDVIEQYERGGRGDPSTDPLIKPLSLSESEKADLEAFLVSLTDDDFLSDPRFEP
jgi:cytochrome c peroxidase